MATCGSIISSVASLVGLGGLILIRYERGAAAAAGRARYAARSSMSVFAFLEQIAPALGRFHRAADRMCERPLYDVVRVMRWLCRPVAEGAKPRRACAAHADFVVWSSPCCMSARLAP